jgi:Uma2 family endonuclease
MRTTVFPEEIIVAKGGHAVLLPAGVDPVRTVVPIDTVLEIPIPDTKPATEFLFGRFVQKVSPKRWHGVLQGRTFAALEAWDPAGSVSTEARFTIRRLNEIPHSVVPDVSYMPRAQFLAIPIEERADPAVMPLLLVEILSPGDRRGKVRRKVELYLSAGTGLVLIVDPAHRTLVAYEPDGTSRTWMHGERFEHHTLPGFTLDLAAYFDVLDDYGL